ncbi:MAG: hypothetical protein ACI85G_000617, partial [Psychroserpens sp.]
MFRSLFIAFLILPSALFAQTDGALRDSILSIFDVMRTAEDAQKIVAGARLEVLFEAYYSKPENFDEEFDSVPFLGQISSWDGFVKMLCWNIAFEDESFKYYAVMRHKPTKETVAITVFEDSVDDWDRIDRKLIRPNNWYGAL